MGLKAILVDSAVITRRIASGDKVAGETPMIDQDTATFKCRVTAPTSGEINDDKIKFVQYVRSATMIVPLRYDDGVDMDIRAEDVVTVQSGPFAGKYEVLGEPSPIRKKKKMLLYNVRLQRYDK